jgi:multiple sugar transport system permease protein
VFVNPQAQSGLGRLPRLRPRPGEGWRDQVAGWLFCAPAVALVVLFLLIPIALAAWVSVSNYNGIGSPLASGVHWAGFANYKALLTQPGLAQQTLGQSVRDTFYYVLFVVPIQTFLALVLAVVVSRKGLFARGFFRTAYYFPAITSSVAIAVVVQFLFSGSGTINAALGFIGVHGPNWFNDPSGILTDLLGDVGVHNGPGVLVNHGLLGISWWQWLSGPSVAMCALIFLAIWTTSGTMMLIFLPALYNISAEVEEAAQIDGASAWRQFWKITVPLVRPVMFVVLTLGIIGTWQVFDSVWLITAGMPEQTTLSPAFLAYQTSFQDQQWGQGAAIAFLLFAVIIVLVLLQRWWLRSREFANDRRTRRELRRFGGIAGTALRAEAAAAAREAGGDGDAG